MFRTLIPAVVASAFLAGPVLAQMDHSKMDHSTMDHSTMDHATMDHGDHEHAMEAEPQNDSMDDALQLADQPELAAALAAGGEPVVAKVLGAVCDFCALAMNKTFGKRDEVAAVYVDLDAKTLNLVLKPGMSMDDETLTKVVKKSGYKVDSIARGEALVKA